MEELNEQFECDVCGNFFDLEEEREPGLCGYCAQDDFEL